MEKAFIILAAILLSACSINANNTENAYTSTDETHYSDTSAEPASEKQTDYTTEEETAASAEETTSEKTEIVIGGIDKTPGKNTLTDLPRVPVGKKGHYLVSTNEHPDKTGFLIEAEDGTDLKKNLSLVLIDEDDEVYGISYDTINDDIHHNYVYAIMNSDFKIFGDSDYSIRYYYCINFDGLKVYAMSKDDPANTKYTSYFDGGGNTIEDIYQYLAANGKDPASGRFKIRNTDNETVGEGVFGQEFDTSVLLPKIAGFDEIAPAAENTDHDYTLTARVGN